MQDLYSSIVLEIIKYQEMIIGPIAWSEAGKVQGLVIDKNTVQVKGDGKVVVENLVKRYANIFGQVSVEVCKDAVRPLLQSISEENVPAILL